jgi:hypothetical protein
MIAPCVLRERYGHYVLRGFFQEFPCVGCFLILCVLALTRLISRHKNCHWQGLRKSWNRTKKSRYSFPFQWISIFHVLAQLWSNIQKFLACRAWENEGFPWGSLTAHSPLQSATLLSQHYHYLRWPNLHVRRSVAFYIIFCL